MNFYQETFKVRSNETDANQNITIPSLASYLQEVAWSHSIELKMSFHDLIPKGLTWVMFRLAMYLEKLPKHGEKVTIETWPSGATAKHAFRDYRVLDANGKLIGTAKSSWVIFDFHQRKVVPLPDFIKNTPIDADRENVEYKQEKISVGKQFELKKDIGVGWYDIDVNRHVNNLSYIRWLLDTLPVNFLQKQRLKELDIVFRAESSLGDQLKLLANQLSSEEGQFDHCIVKEDKALIIAKTEWEAIK